MKGSRIFAYAPGQCIFAKESGNSKFALLQVQTVKYDISTNYKYEMPCSNCPYFVIGCPFIVFCVSCERRGIKAGIPQCTVSYKVALKL